MPLNEAATLPVARALSDAFDDRSVDDWSALIQRERASRRLDVVRSQVATSNGRIVGACLVNLGPDGTARIGAVGVRRLDWGQGTGRRLVERVLQHLYEAGCRWVTLEVEPDNERARALYEHLGFIAGRDVRVLTAHRSDVEFANPAPLTAVPIPLDEGVAALDELHPEIPAFQRRRPYVASFADEGGVCTYGVRLGGALAGVVIQRGRSILDYAVADAQPDVLQALVHAAFEMTRDQRLINVVQDDPLGELLVSMGFRVESSAIEMVLRRT